MSNLETVSTESLDMQTSPISCMKMHPGEEGSIVVGGAVRIGATAVSVLMAAGLGLLDGGIVGQEGYKEKSHIEAEAIDLRPEMLGCFSLETWKTDGSAVRTRYEALGQDLNFTGHGAVMKTGKVINEACFDAKGVIVKMEDGAVDAATNTKRKVVKIVTTSLRADTKSSAADMVIVDQDPNLSQMGGGILDFGGAALKAVCEGGTYVLTLNNVDGKWCEVTDVLGKWNRTEQAKLRAEFLVKVLQHVQEDCAPLDWKSQKAAITDAFRQQAKDEGKDPYLVDVEFVDENLQPTDQVPDYTKSTIDGLIKDGVIARHVAGFNVELEFSNINCKPIGDGYKAMYPNKVTGVAE